MFPNTKNGSVDVRSGNSEKRTSREEMAKRMGSTAEMSLCVRVASKLSSSTTLLFTRKCKVLLC